MAGKGWLDGVPRCVVPMLVRGSDIRVLMVEVVVVVEIVALAASRFELVVPVAGFVAIVA